jgi:hypothetical protein
MERWRMTVEKGKSEKVSSWSLSTPPYATYAHTHAHTHMEVYIYILYLTLPPPPPPSHLTTPLIVPHQFPLHHYHHLIPSRSCRRSLHRCGLTPTSYRAYVRWTLSISCRPNKGLFPSRSAAAATIVSLYIVVPLHIYIYSVWYLIFFRFFYFFPFSLVLPTREQR